MDVRLWLLRVLLILLPEIVWRCFGDYGDYANESEEKLSVTEGSKVADHEGEADF